MALGTFTDQDWTENFRVSSSTFYVFCKRLTPYLQRKNTQLTRAICVEHRVAITLWYLATCGEYRTITHSFGVARCTLCIIVHDTGEAIVDVLLKTYIHFPQGFELSEVVKGFKEKWGMIQYVLDP